MASPATSEPRSIGRDHDLAQCATSCAARGSPGLVDVLPRLQRVAPQGPDPCGTLDLRRPGTPPRAPRADPQPAPPGQPGRARPARTACSTRGACSPRTSTRTASCFTPCGRFARGSRLADEGSPKPSTCFELDAAIASAPFLQDIGHAARRCRGADPDDRRAIRSTARCFSRGCPCREGPTDRTVTTSLDQPSDACQTDAALVPRSPWPVVVDQHRRSRDRHVEQHLIRQSRSRSCVGRSCEN